MNNESFENKFKEIQSLFSQQGGENSKTRYLTFAIEGKTILDFLIIE